MQWLESIHRIRALKLTLARIDPRGGMPVAPPPGAPEQAIAGAERRLGFPLPPSYRALLALHDGWPQLYAGAGLLGVRALARGAFVDLARMVIDERVAGCRGGEAAPRSGRRRGGLVPFGIDTEAETIFAWDTRAVRSDGEMEIVLWCNEIGLRVESFPDLLDVVAEMLGAEVEDRRARAAAGELSPQPRPAAPSAPNPDTPAPTSRVRPLEPALRPSSRRPIARIAAFG
ncbi:MAG: SMI1/KNR4 family protein [Polyangiaceae bacterium]|nr:SMI1/KNR4 family protein [Polyangiaceae bacterium]